VELVRTQGLGAQDTHFFGAASNRGVLLARLCVNCVGGCVSFSTEGASDFGLDEFSEFQHENQILPRTL